jgi:hypothetical protein
MRTEVASWGNSPVLRLPSPMPIKSKVKDYPFDVAAAGIAGR